MQIRKELIPTVRQIAQIGLFFAALLVVEFSIIPFTGAVWLFFIVDWFYSGISVALTVLCARVTEHPYAVLIIAFCKGLLYLFFMSYGGPVMPLYGFLPPFMIQLVFLLSHTNGESLKFNLLGGALYGFAAACIFFFLVVGFVKMEIPLWLMLLRILNVTVTSVFGGFLGWKVGDKMAKGSCHA
jgi:hypothetical protein